MRNGILPRYRRSQGLTGIFGRRVDANSLLNAPHTGRTQPVYMCSTPTTSTPNRRPPSKLDHLFQTYNGLPALSNSPPTSLLHNRHSLRPRLRPSHCLQRQLRLPPQFRMEHRLCRCLGSPPSLTSSRPSTTERSLPLLYRPPSITTTDLRADSGSLSPSSSPASKKPCALSSVPSAPSTSKTRPMSSSRRCCFFLRRCVRPLNPRPPESNHYSQP